MSYTELDSILGQPIPQYVTNQFYIRTRKTLDDRDDNSLVYMANKSSWVRVVSSINITGSYSDTIARLTGLASNDEMLAKSFVLFGGTSAYFGSTDNYQNKNTLETSFEPLEGTDLSNYTKRKTTVYSPRNYYSSYNQNIDSTYGLRPMAGITSAKITTQGKLGSILQADIDFKVNTKQQLDIVDILYFKLGYTIFIEWGNTFFFKQKNNPSNQLDTYPVLQKSEDYAVDPFEEGMDEAKLRIKIAKSIRETDGNYDAMVGIVTNFNFSTNTEGGYDCKLKVIGPGMLAESMRTNAIPSLPAIFKDAVARIANIATNINKTRAEEIAKRERDQQLALIATQAATAKQDPTDKNNYPACVRDRIDGDFEIKTVNSQTFAAAKAITSELKDYKFFIDSNYIQKTASGDKQSPYQCDGPNIVDSVTKTIIGKKIEPLTYDSFIKNLDTEGTFVVGQVNNPGPYRYTKTFDPAYDDGTKNYYIRDNQQTNVADQYYYVFTKEKKVIKSDGTTKPQVQNKVSALLDLNTINFGDITGLGWSGIISTTDVNEFTAGKGAGSSDIQRVIVPESKASNGTIDYLAVTEYDPTDGNSFGDYINKQNTRYIIEYASQKRGFKTKGKMEIRIENYFAPVPGLTYGAGFTVGSVYTDAGKEAETRKKMVDAVVADFNKGNRFFELDRNQVVGGNTIPKIFVTAIPAVLPATVTDATQTGGSASSTRVVEVQQLITVAIGLQDEFTLVKQWDIKAFIGQTPQQQQTSPQSPQTPAVPPIDPQYTKIDAKALQDSEAAMYKSQLEAMLRTIQLITIARFIKDDGTISDVNSIKWTEGKDKAQLYELFKDGALGSDILSTVIDSPDTILTDTNKQKYYTDLPKKTRFLINLYCGFHRSLMKDSGKDPNSPDKQTILDKLTEKDSEYKVNFNELLQSFVIPYYQTKNLVEGGDIHYPAYVTLGFFFMMLNHCSFLYDTDENNLNIPLFYLDFNQGSNIILSSDFMLSANPYRFVVPFSGNFDSYKKLFDPSVLTTKGDAIIASEAGGSTSKLWSGDGISKKFPPFKFDKSTATSKPVYRGKSMNILISIDYLLDTIKKHATSDENNSVYFRSLMDEIISDLGKSLGNFNVLRLAYDDYANCFYVVDDQAIPGENVLSNTVNPNDLLSSVPQELPLYGKESIAKSFSLQTDMSSKLGNMLAISANSSVKNQTTAGVDGTSVGNSSLYAIDRYKKAVTAVNDNSKNKTTDSGSLQRKALAASRFNASIESYYIGGSRSEEGVEQATNFYIESVAKARNSDEDPELKATMLLPLSLNFSTDGISGLGIYHAFTVPEALLPYSYTVEAGGFGQNATRRTGFIVTGLDHTIENNSWTTNVKGSMYYVKNVDNYKTKVGKQAEGRFRSVPPPPNNTQGSSGTGGSSGFTGTVPKFPDKAAAKASVIAATDEIQAMKTWTAATEGCILYIQWDISNWRTGYGSGTITLADSGKQIKLDNNQNKWPSGVDRAAGKLTYTDVTGLVQKDGQQFPNGKIWNPKMSNLSQAAIITQQDADANLEYRIKNDFLPLVKKTLQGRGISWDSLNIPMKVAFFKTSYAYGNISQGGKWIVDAYLAGGQPNVVAVASQKASVPNNSDYGADKIAFLLS